MVKISSYLAHSSKRVAKCALRTEFPSFSLSSDFSIFVNKVGNFGGNAPVHLTIWDFVFSSLCSLSIISSLHTLAQGKGIATEVSTPEDFNITHIKVKKFFLIINHVIFL